MKIIFLDIDGVLNDDAFWHKRRESIIEKSYKEPGISEKESHIRFNIGQINPLKVELLNKLTSATGAKIVVSSTWRGHPDLLEILKRAGVTAQVIGMTPRVDAGVITTPGYTRACTHSLRGQEIYAYIERFHPYTKNYRGEPDGSWKPPRKDLESYLILDDDGDMLWWQRNNFICTNHRKGLTKRDVNKGIKILGILEEEPK